MYLWKRLALWNIGPWKMEIFFFKNRWKTFYIQLLFVVILFRWQYFWKSCCVSAVFGGGSCVCMCTAVVLLPPIYTASAMLRHELHSKNAPIIVNENIYTTCTGVVHTAIWQNLTQFYFCRMLDHVQSQSTKITLHRKMNEHIIHIFRIIHQRPYIWTLSDVCLYLDFHKSVTSYKKICVLTCNTMKWRWRGQADQRRDQVITKIIVVHDI